MREDTAKQMAAMRRLGMSEDEIKQVLDDDKRIERGEDLFPISKDQQAIVKKMTQAPRAVKESPPDKKTPTVYNFDKRAPKANPTKEGIISELSELLTNSAYMPQDITIKNKSREITFTIGSKEYSLTLVEHRAKKS